MASCPQTFRWLAGQRAGLALRVGLLVWCAVPGADAGVLFNASGTIRDCVIPDAFCPGIPAASSPDAVLINNTVIRCPVRQSKNHRAPKHWGKPERGS